MKSRTVFTRIVAVVILSAVACLSVFPQRSVVLIPGQSTITIKGTSSLHDWEEKVEKFDVNLELAFREKEIAGIDHVHFNCKSGSILSENSIMNKKTHSALQADKYPEIIFKLVSVDHLTSQDGSFSGMLVGDIVLAGVTKRINLAFTGKHNGNKITIQGSKELNMNDFKITPPTALMGTLKTGEQITVSFLLNFQVS